jgi:hypothetical protein
MAKKKVVEEVEEDDIEVETPKKGRIFGDPVCEVDF